MDKISSMTSKNEFATEQDMREYISPHLQFLLDLEVLEDEFRLPSGDKIDSLAIDTMNRPTIVEYKLDASGNILSQGISYAKELRSTKKGIDLLAEKELGRGLDWSTVHLILIARSFDRKMLETAKSISAKGIDIDVYRSEGITSKLCLLHLESGTKTEKKLDKPERTVPASLDKHLNKMLPNVREHFNQLRNAIMNIDPNINEKPTKVEVGYWIKQRFAMIEFHKSHYWVYIRTDSNFKDPHSLSSIVPSGMNYVWERRIKVREEHAIKDILELIQQSYTLIKRKKG